MITMPQFASRLACRTVHALGPELSSRAAGPVARHAASCLRCQADAVRYRKLQTELAALGFVSDTSPPGVLPRVESAVWFGDSAGANGRSLRGWVVGVAGAAAVAGVAAAAAVHRGRVAAAR